MKIIFAFTFFLIYSSKLIGADTAYIKRITDTLSSAVFFGRGYVKNGMSKAGNYITAEMKNTSLEVRHQSFRYPVNSFPGKMSLTINGEVLTPGLEFLIGPESKSCKGAGTLDEVDSITWTNSINRVVIKQVDKLTWSVAQEQADYTTFKILKPVTRPFEFSCNLEAKHLKKFRGTNIIGSIKGTTKPDSVIVFTAHYDHLGGIGSETYFPGANDNAGGIALMLDLAKYYKENPPAYTMQFIAFAGEEAGLLGSKFYTENPLTDLSKIRFLINLDLVGNGDEGITVVNATAFTTEFALLQQLNEKYQLLTAINSRGKAANSDHYWFTEKGVPSFFIYTLGKRKAYHDVHDVAATVPWYEANDLSKLLIEFSKTLMGK